MTAFGIDFGTTNSVLALTTASGMETVPLDDPPGEWAELGFDRVLPTVLAPLPGGAISCGWAAKRSDKRLDAVKRLFSTDDAVTVGGRSMQIEEAAGIFFRQIRDRAADAGLTLDRAVVTIPANSRGVARFRTKISAGLSGIEVLALLNEPTAAAMAYSREISDGERVLVFDFGGGTLDVTILRQIGGVFIEEASKGVQRLGGIDIDDAFEAAVRNIAPPGAIIDRFDLERAKVLLSSQDSTALSLVGGGVVEVERGLFEDAIRPLVQKTTGPIERCLADLGSPHIDHLVMVGGSSKIPYVQRHVREVVRQDPMEGVDPMTAIAEGAALAAGILLGEVVDFDFFVGTEHALGVVIHGLDDTPQFSELIPRNTKLPASSTDTYNARMDGQESVFVQVIEGDPERPVEHEDNVILKAWDVQLLEPRSVSDSAFTIRYEYDVDGILHVRVEDLHTATVMMDEELTFGAGASKSDLVAIRRRIDQTTSAAPTGSLLLDQDESTEPSADSHLAPDSERAVRTASEKMLPFLDDEAVAEFEAAIDAVTRAAEEGSGEDDARASLERLIREHAYLL